MPTATTDFAPPPRRLGTLKRPSCEIHFEVTGSGPAIVFAHGLGGNHLSWWQQVAHFSRHYTCVTFAHRGFAPSSPIAGGPDPRDYAGDLDALIQHLQLRDVCVVAQSMGGWCAVEYALTHPAALRALVLASTIGTLDPRLIDEPERSRLDTWAKQSAALRAKWREVGIHPAAGERMAREQPALHQLYRHIDDANRALDKEALRARMQAARVRKPQELTGAGCPILFISSDEDVQMPPFAADAIVRVVPNACVVHIEQAGHSAYFEQPAQFNAMVAAFVQNPSLRAFKKVN
ncbi:MAG: alpha/beta hydrolase [Betaproteobacteria bacterium]|nr:alpha/beta hydrolase [Betaproteobacteria bacterium]